MCDHLSLLFGGKVYYSKEWEKEEEREAKEQKEK